MPLSKALTLLAFSVLLRCALATFIGAFRNTYPELFRIPPIDSPQVKRWLSQIDMTKVPNVPVVKCVDQDPQSESDHSCDWTNTGCTTGDIVRCPKGEWGLSYDDGPTEHSPTLYQFLAEKDQKATLFYIGSNVHNLWKNAVKGCEGGHHIGVHTWSHNPSTCLTNEQFVAEVKWTETIIKEVCGVIPKYFRPPYGDVDNRIRALLQQMGYLNVIWDVDPMDWDLPPDGRRTIAQVDQYMSSAVRKVSSGHISLEHELSKNSVEEAIKWLPILQAAFTVKNIAECQGDHNPYRDAPIANSSTASTSAHVSSNGINSMNITSVSTSITPSPTTSSAPRTVAVGVFIVLMAGIVSTTFMKLNIDLV